MNTIKCVFVREKDVICPALGQKIAPIFGSKNPGKGKYADTIHTKLCASSM